MTESVSPTPILGGPYLPVSGPYLPAAANVRLSHRLRAADAAGGVRRVGLGWHPDLADLRDFTLGAEPIQKSLRDRKSILVRENAKLPTKIDNRAWCSPIEDQRELGSCTAQAVVGAMEYMMRRGKPRAHEDGSRLFVYKVTRRLLGWTGDTGAYLRTTMQSIATFGMPPESHWTYEISRFDEEPSAFLYSYAQNYQALKYTRLDPYDKAAKDAFVDIKKALAAGYPVVFGFPVYSSLSNAADIPYPTNADSLDGGHAVMAVGYDDNHKTAAGEQVPSLLIRNSWGTGWGDNGYGYLPNRYVLDGLAEDFWTVFKIEWIDSQEFS